MTNYTMPNGDVIELNDMHKCPEILFDASNVGIETGSVQDLVNTSMGDLDLVLAGGSTMFPGFTERLKNELSTLGRDPSQYQVKGKYETRCVSSWLGASILAPCKSSHQFYHFITNITF